MLIFPWLAHEGMSEPLQGEFAGRGFDLMFISSKETSVWPISRPSRSVNPALGHLAAARVC